MFAPKDQDFVANEGLDDLQNRKAYLVQGPGHCGACHTLRGLAYQELALSLKDGDGYQSGAVIGAWGQGYSLLKAHVSTFV